LILHGTQEDTEEAWQAYGILEATGWHTPPYAGGWMEQPELLMDNVFKIARAVGERRK
jgi:hypothetical protein